MKNKLADCLKECLCNDTIDKITISDISEKCGINRQTFYYHFSDIYSLLVWLFEREMAEKVWTDEENMTWKELLGKLLAYICENKAFCSSVLNSVEHRRLNLFIREYIKKAVSRMMKADNDAAHSSFICEFYSHAIAGMIESRITGDLDISDEEFIDNIEYIINKHRSIILL